MNPNPQRITAFAPATSANVAVGFDLLGYPIPVLGDHVSVAHADQPGIQITLNNATDLPTDPEKNTAGVAIQSLCDALHIQPRLRVEILKGIPLCSGLGGSAASAAAAVMATNTLLGCPLSKPELLPHALAGESLQSSQPHADNVAPALLGGLQLIRQRNPLTTVALPIPDVFVVLVHPNLSINTAESRRLLPQTIKLADHIEQSMHLAGFLNALYAQNTQQLADHLMDCIIEPNRSEQIPGFYAVQAAAMAHGAMGCSISGAGPTLFAWAETAQIATTIAQCMCDAFHQENIACQHWVSTICPNGAVITSSKGLP